ncbi:otogelin-like protein [Amphiura filiformis]|uniref:otogelin-like protein n=1 Tax=Amphiura filiformis TaxID=82378 RepID=UPI003B21D5DB
MTACMLQFLMNLHYHHQTCHYSDHAFTPADSTTVITASKVRVGPDGEIEKRLTTKPGEILVTQSRKTPQGITTTTVENFIITAPEFQGCCKDGVQWPYGAQIPTTEACTTLYCVENVGIVPEREECDLTCEGTLRSYEGVCCPICEKEVVPCQHVSFMKDGYKINMPNKQGNEHYSCVAAEPVEFSYCSGWCESNSTMAINWENPLRPVGMVQNNCRCCKPIDTRQRTVKMHCKDGMRDFDYHVIEQCTCQECGALREHGSGNGYHGGGNGYQRGGNHPFR